MRFLKNKRGQGLVEYMVIVAFMAVATMSAVRLLSHTTAGKLTQITRSLQGAKGEVEFERIDKKHYRKKDMSDFFQGSNNHKN